MPPRPPRLLVVVNVYRPDLGGGVLFTDLCEGLARRGFDVTVRCAYPYYPEWRDKSGENGLRIRVEKSGGVRVERFGLFIPSKPNALAQRLAYEASFFASLARRVPRRGAFDLVMAFCPLMGGVAYGALVRRRVGCPLWLNVQDLPADAAAAGGITSGGAVGRAMEGVQRALFNAADVWSTISPVMAERLAPLRRRDQPVLYLPNWLHASLADALAALPPKAGRLPAHPVRLLYSGNIGTKQDLLRFCQTLQASDAPFAFRIQGSGSRAAEVRDWIAARGDTRFTFHDLTDEAGLARALHEADLFVVTERAGSGGSFIPSKLIPGMASGTPILAVCDATSPLGRELETARPGPRFDWDDGAGPARLLARLEHDPATFVAWQHNALRHAQTYEREGILDRYAAALHAVLAGRNPDG